MSTTIEPANGPERRAAFVATLRDVECRQSGNGEDFTLTGHAAVFNSWSEDLSTWAGTFRERIAPGAFTDVLDRSPDVRLLYNHDGLTLARTKSGSLELSEDENGLRVWARLAPTSVAKDLRMAMQRGDVDQMSFAFTIAEDEWREDHETEEVERTIVRVQDLFDVSVVSFPAYPDTDAAMRELRSAADAGKIHPAAQVDPVGIVTTTDRRLEKGREVVEGTTTEDAPAETDPAVDVVSPLAALRAEASALVQRERESFLRLTKELTRETHRTGRGGA